MIKGFIRMSKGYTIKEKWRAGLDWEKYLDMIKDIRDEKNAEFLIKEKQAKGEPDNKKLIREVDRLEKEILTLDGIISDGEREEAEPWVNIHNETYDRYKNLTHYTRVEPITIDRFIDDMFDETSFVIFASATPIVPEGWPYLELSSPFPKEVRPWTYEGCGKMNLNSRTSSIPKLAEYIKGVRGKREGKFFVHCFSYQIAADLARCLREIGVLHLTVQSRADVVLEGGTDTVLRNQAIESFLSSENMDQICLSVGMEAGIDLWHPKGTKEYVGTQFIVKLPYPNPYDPVVVAEKKYIKNAEAELNKEMARKITQMYGRPNRDAVKDTITIITDGNWPYWYAGNERYFPGYFREAKVKSKDVKW
jgi:hypothetical protein